MLLDEIEGEVFRVLTLGHFLREYFDFHWHKVVPCSLCKKKKEEIIVPRFTVLKVSNMIRRSPDEKVKEPTPSESGEKTLSLGVPIFYLNNQWMCMDCILKHVEKHAYPQRHRYPTKPEKIHQNLAILRSGNLPPKEPPRYLLEKTEVRTWSDRRRGFADSAKRHLELFLEHYYGKEKARCEPCDFTYTSVTHDHAFRIGGHLVCVDCVIERIDGIERHSE